MWVLQILRSSRRMTVIAMLKDISHARADFPALAQQMNGKPLAFLDTGASAQKPQIVIDAMSKVMEQGYSNIHRGLYKISQDLTEQCENVRGKVAKFLNAPSAKNIVFTKNTTEAVNLVAQSWGKHNLTSDDEILLTEMEHHANIVPWQLLQEEIGFAIKIIRVTDEGELDLESFGAQLNHKTKFIGLVHVSNALGTINPVKEIIEIAKDFYADMKILIDGSQAVVHTKVDVQGLGADFYVFTGHKIYGPTGIGVLYATEESYAQMHPYQGGGDMIETVSFEKTTFKEAPHVFEAGTPAIVEMIGLGAAIDYMQEIGIENIETHEHALLTYGTEQLKNIKGIKLYGEAENKAGIMSFTLDYAHTSDIAMVLDQCGVALRTGHHCCMPLMERFGIDGTVRASLGLYSNKDDIDQLIGGLKKVEELFS